MNQTLNFRLPISAGCWLALCLAAAVATNGADSQPDRRDYENGPLTPADFTAAVPSDTGGRLALTMTELVYDLSYRCNGRADRYVARTESLVVRATVVRSASWNLHPQDRPLMDHEQGHFDLTYIAALRLRSRFAGDQRPTGTGANPDEAVRNLREKVDRALHEANEQVKQGHLDYDRLTDHGARMKEQVEQRRLQKDKIEELVETSEGLRKPEQDRTPARRKDAAIQP